MKNCVILTMNNLSEFECYDSLIEKPMAALGWKTHEVSWQDKNVNWNDYQAAIIRSPWDYQDHCKEFLTVLESIQQSSAILMNSLDLVRWNISKTYLLELERKGIPIVPTLWKNCYAEELIESAFIHFESDNLIIKPCISANADDTYRINRFDNTINHEKLEALFERRIFMIQPFIPAIIEEGEYSLFYFNGEYSHAILKTPRSNDFRVQEEHGGQLKKITPEKSLIKTAHKTLSEIPYPTLYARLDFVRYNGKFTIMEAELIEPSLYFNMDKDSPERFAKAFVNYYNDQI